MVFTEVVRDRIDEYAESGQEIADLEEIKKRQEEIADLEEIKKRQEEIKAEKNELLIQKTDRDVNYAHIETLLEVIDAIEGKAEPAQKDWPPECHDYVDFMERTREKRKPGPVTEFRNEDVQRYIEKIVVYGDRLEVVFKAGVSVTVEV